LQVLDALVLKDFSDQDSMDYFKFNRASGTYYFWIKMDFVANLRDVDGMVQTGEAKKMLDLLRTESDALLTLGKVVAVDIFIGNQDRFEHVGKMTEKGTNWGNIMFQEDAQTKKHKAVGLDWYEAQGAASNLFTPPPDDWAGPLLNDYNKLMEFATNAIKTLNDYFQKKVVGVSPGDLIPTQGIAQFYTGLTAGRTQLKVYLHDRCLRKGAEPPGVTKRMKALDWYPTTAELQANAATSSTSSTSSPQAPPAPPRPTRAAPAVPQGGAPQGKTRARANARANQNS
jgi:hypothetical protein